jgi:hypothetical protein
LNSKLGNFFAAVRTRLGELDPVFNPPIRYAFNIGLPISLKSSGAPFNIMLAVFISTKNNNDMINNIGNAIRSWMKIQWQGNPEQMRILNNTIKAVSMVNFDKMTAAAQGNVICDEIKIEDVTDAIINPFPDFQDLIRKSV